MNDFMISQWWIVLVRGLAAILFGVFAIAWPALTLLILVVLFAAHAAVDGVLALVIGLKMRRISKDSPWAFLVITGLISVIAGVLAFLWPGLTATAFLFLIAFWAIARGVFEIMTAIRFREFIPNEWFLVLAGSSSVLFGVLLLAWPAAGLLSLIWLVGVLSIAFGIPVCLLAFRLRKLTNVAVV